MVFVALLIGFFLGTRARQLAASAKMVGKAIRSFTIKIPDPGTAQAADDGLGEMDSDPFADKELDVSDFLNTDPTALDDHPDIELNPCLMYQIRKHREQMKEEKRIAALAAEGLSEEEIAQRLLSGDLPVDPNAKQNALAVLIEAGARVLPVSSGDSNQNALIQERRRQQRTVDSYLQKALSVETARSSAFKPARLPGGGKTKNAYEVAMDPALAQDADHLKRFQENLRIAKDSRNILRAWKAERAARGIVEPDVDNSDGEQEKGEETEVIEKHGHGGALDPSQLALIQAEFGDEDIGEEDLGLDTLDA